MRTMTAGQACDFANVRCISEKDPKKCPATICLLEVYHTLTTCCIVHVEPATFEDTLGLCKA